MRPLVEPLLVDDVLGPRAQERGDVRGDQVDEALGGVRQLHSVEWNRMESNGIEWNRMESNGGPELGLTSDESVFRSDES